MEHILPWVLNVDGVSEAYVQLTLHMYTQTRTLVQKLQYKIV